MNTLSIFIFSLNAILPLIFMILLGYFLKSIHFFTKEFLNYANKTVFYVCLPVLLFKNITDVENLSMIRWDSVGYVMTIILLLLIIGSIITLFIPENSQKGVILQCVFRSNFALIGVPLAELICGNAGVKVAAILSAFTIPAYNALAVIVLTIFQKTNQKISIKNILINIIKNPLIIGVLSGLVLVSIRPYLPHNMTLLSQFTCIQTTIIYISRAATPLALIVLGGQFEFSKIAGFREQIIIGTVSRIILAPLLGVGIAVILTMNHVLHFDAATFSALISLFGTPVAVSSAIMAESMHNDGQLAGQLVVWTSLFSVFTLFITIFIVRSLGLL